MSTFYSSGTVSVTNASTTATLSVPVPVVVEVQPGDLLAAGTGLAVIASINTARTQLTLARAWAAATVTAGNFEIILLADSIRTLNITSTLLADLRTGPLQGRFAAGTAGAPGVTSQAHQTSGLFWGSGFLAASVNGTERARFTTAGMQLTGNLTGTAVTQSATDITAGRLMRTRDHGLGVAITLTAGDNLNNLPRGSAFYFNALSANTAGNNYPVSSAGSLLQVSDGNSGRATQIFTRFGTAATYVRSLGSGEIWSPWREIYTQANILGTVSQSGGVPTDAIIQRGSNANGEFVRFADGTQICWVLSEVQEIATVSGGVHQSALYEINLPAAFAGDYVGSVSVTGTTIAWGNARRVGVASAQVRLFRGTSDSSPVSYIACFFGRWL